MAYKDRDDIRYFAILAAEYAAYPVHFLAWMLSDCLLCTISVRQLMIMHGNQMPIIIGAIPGT